MLAPARAVALFDGSQNADRAVKPGHNIGHGNAHLLRLAAGFAGDRHQPRHALDQKIISGTSGIRPILPEAGDRTVDEPRVEVFQAAVIQPVFGKAADLEVFDQDVGVSDQGADFLLPLGRAEIGGDRGFAAIGRIEIGGGSIAVTFDEGRAPAAGVVTFRRFDLDHPGPQIGQRLTDPGPCQNACKFDDFQSTQRGHGNPFGGRGLTTTAMPKSAEEGKARPSFPWPPIRNETREYRSEPVFGGAGFFEKSVSEN